MNTTAEQVEFTDKKSVFYSKYEGIFATPKKLNRSQKAIPQQFIDKIESGECNSADIENLQKIVPVFVYKTCLTIHGNFPDINRTHIGYYKNIIQNQNGSLEIRWSAIDNHKKKLIAKYIREHLSFNTREDSTHGIYFEKSETANEKEKAIEILRQYRKEAEKMSIPGMMAKYFVSGYSYFGRYYIYLTIMPYQVTGSPLFIASKLTGESESNILEQYNLKEEEQRKYAEDIKKRSQEATEKKEKAHAEALIGIKHLKEVSIQPIVGSIYIKPVVDNAYRPCYRIFRISEKGTFGRVKVDTYLSKEPIIDNSKFAPHMKGKQLKINEITIGKVYA